MALGPRVARRGGGDLGEEALPARRPQRLDEDAPEVLRRAISRDARGVDQAGRRQPAAAALRRSGSGRAGAGADDDVTAAASRRRIGPLTEAPRCTAVGRPARGEAPRPGGRAPGAPSAAPRRASARRDRERPARRASRTAGDVRALDAGLDVADRRGRPAAAERSPLEPGASTCPSTTLPRRRLERDRPTARRPRQPPTPALDVDLRVPERGDRRRPRRCARRAARAASCTRAQRAQVARRRQRPPAAAAPPAAPAISRAARSAAQRRRSARASSPPQAQVSGGGPGQHDERAGSARGRGRSRARAAGGRRRSGPPTECRYRTVRDGSELA